MQLFENRAEVIFDCLFRQSHLHRDFFVGPALGNQCQHPALLERKNRKRIFIGRRCLPDYMQNTGSDCRVQDGFTRCNIMQRSDETLCIDILEQITMGALTNGFINKLGLFNRS